jgi:hypothetical protein
VPARPPTARPPVAILALLGVARIAMLLSTALTVWWLGPTSSPGPSPSAAVALGRSYAPKLAASLAAGFEAEADALHAGKTFGEANAALKKTYHDAAEASFERHAGAAITTLIPDGTEIKDQAERDALEAFHRGFARGLRGKR